MSETKRKLGFWESIENFWYYYKWWVVLGVLLALGIWLGVWYASTTVDDTSGDLTVVSLFAHPLTSEEYDIDRRLAGVVADANGDGESKVVLKPYYITEKKTSESDQVSKEQFEAGLQKCYGDLLILDEPSLDSYLPKDIFEPIGNYVDLSQIPEEDIVYRGDVPVAVKLTNSKVLSDMRFIIDEVYVSVMFIPDNASEKTLACRENAKDAIAELLVQKEIEVNDE